MKQVILFLLTALHSITHAQNLVPNPSFEEYDTCPNNFSEMDNYVSQWHSYSETPDYFNSCANASTGVSTPFNWEGGQLPFTGNGYAGVISFAVGNDYREIIGVQLTGTLTIGQTYYVSFRVSSGYGELGGDAIYIFSNKIGAKFSMVGYSETTPTPIDNFAHIYTNEIITDTANWVKIQGSFLADAPYPYLMLGNFFDNEHTDTITVNNQPNTSYYYIDDVCVSTDSAVCGFISTPAFVMPSAFSPNGDNTNETYFPVHYSSLLAIREFRIYNRWGQLLYNNPNMGWNGTYKGEPQPVDTYAYYIYIDIPDPDNPSQLKSLKQEGSFTLLR